MSDKPYNLKVRVNMAPDEIVKPKEPEPQYLWGRIVLALLVLLVLFWGAFKLVSWLLAPAEPVTTAGVDPGSNGANARAGNKLHRHKRVGVNLLQVINQLGQIFNGIDVVVWGRADQRHARPRVAQLCDVFVDFVTR